MLAVSKVDMRIIFRSDSGGIGTTNISKKAYTFCADMDH